MARDSSDENRDPNGLNEHIQVRIHVVMQLTFLGKERGKKKSKYYWNKPKSESSFEKIEQEYLQILKPD